MAGSGVGNFVFAPLIGLLIESNGWKFAMSICACIIFQSCVFGALLRPLNSSVKSASEKKNKMYKIFFYLNLKPNKEIYLLYQLIIKCNERFE